MSRDYLKRLGDNIRKCRVSQGVSQTALANLCDFERQNMNSIEAGKKNITMETLVKISGALGVKARDLLDF